VLTLGGDGTVNEAVNGMLSIDQPTGAERPSAADLPALAPIPGGSGNVFAGALGLPRDPIDAPDDRSGEPVFLVIVSNAAPWTYLGDREVNANPQARFDRGLDVFTLRNMSSFSTLHALSQMLTTKGGELHGRRILTMHDQPSLTLRADRPVAFQIDGEYVGERELVRLRSVPEALRVVA